MFKNHYVCYVQLGFVKTSFYMTKRIKLTIVFDLCDISLYFIRNKHSLFNRHNNYR